MSACTIAFLAGSRRYLASTARLGFHSNSIGSVDNKVLPAINDDMKKTLREHGAPEWFLTRAFSTAANDMWFPTHVELKAASIVTEIVDARTFAMSGLDVKELERNLEQQLLTIRIYSVLKKVDNRAYQELLTVLLDGMKKGKSMPELQNQAHGIFVTIIPKYLRVSPSAPLVRYWHTQVQSLKYLQASPQMCIQYLYPDRRTNAFDLSKFVPQSVAQQELEALADVVNGAATQPVAVTGGAEVILQELFQNSRKFSSQDIEVFVEPMKFMTQPELVCRAFTAYFGELLTLPLDKAGMVLRSFWDDNASAHGTLPPQVKQSDHDAKPAPPSVQLPPAGGLPSEQPQSKPLTPYFGSPPVAGEEVFERVLGGLWALDPNACPGSGKTSKAQPVTITIHGATTLTRSCRFTERSGADAEWNIKAECTSGVKKWTSSVNLVRQGDILKWTNESGTSVFYRC